MFRRTKGINHLTFFCVALFLIHSIWEQVPNIVFLPFARNLHTLEPLALTVMITKETQK
jgi:hypothetical protein